ncbi:hypothetical protein POX_b02707 [Penicillium oxalicum]|uniref:Uncharacterized protein n=1 Tax=Penicillium oxalicum (strain 114-2 / CGMCC 5302) TaxID=933388 RepID=S8AVL2_PENO1|nr:hypothetical protein POX_b02707 [Penicillium oxalicum]EPS30283.1 hypothetical protein PDE_05234 [Penicillium oxalicum 114-2]KAI2792667.1 hypothetical protein POX_b02707 [Penicillium oxalicum]
MKIVIHCEAERQFRQQTQIECQTKDIKSGGRVSINRRRDKRWEGKVPIHRGHRPKPEYRSQPKKERITSSSKAQNAKRQSKREAERKRSKNSPGCRMKGIGQLRRQKYAVLVKF